MSRFAHDLEPVDGGLVVDACVGDVAPRDENPDGPLSRRMRLQASAEHQLADRDSDAVSTRFEHQPQEDGEGCEGRTTESFVESLPGQRIGPLCEVEDRVDAVQELVEAVLLRL